MADLSRRDALFLLAGAVLAPKRDADLLRDLVETSVRFFWEAADPGTGLVKDRTLADGQSDPRRIGSIAATGFVTGIQLGIKLQKGTTTVQFYPDGSFGVGGYSNGRTIELQYDGK